MNPNLCTLTGFDHCARLNVASSTQKRRSPSHGRAHSGPEVNPTSARRSVNYARARSYRYTRATSSESAVGPERVFGEWWKGDSELIAVRDYFQVEDESGERFWIYRAGDGEDAATGSHRWFLHGIFA